MSMSSSEYLRRLQEESKRYIARAKCRDASELTQIHQAQASGQLFQRQKGNLTAYAFGETYGPEDHAIRANTYNNLDPTCCKTNVASGSQTVSGSTGILQAAQKCAVCSDPDPAFNPGVTIPCTPFDRSLPPFAQKLPGTAVPSCKVCKTTYFPGAQPNCGCYSESYDRTLIDKKFGDAGFPTSSTNSIGGR
jgi:hypothetical protein